jgi:hypothetical protein
MTSRLGIALAAALVCATNAQALDVQWKQVINVPKRLGQPPGITIDIVGLEVGDTYAEAKAKMEKIAAEAGSQDISPVREVNNVFRLQTPGGYLTAEYVGQIQMERRLPGQPRVQESLRVVLSAPSSGHQVLGIVRLLSYYEQNEQPRVSEMLARLSDKLKSRPQVFDGGLFRYQFDDGRPFAPPGANILSCKIDMSVNSPDAARNANNTGVCDVIFDLQAEAGISNDHAKSLRFTLSDNERARQNVSADFKFFSDYARSIQTNSSGAAPKL